ncbi:MAG: hypothetical protein QW514_10300 [Thermoprotei archaeon]
MELNNNKNNGVLATVLGVICSMLVALVFGSYIYTWGESERIAHESRVWREEHMRILDKKFDEIKSEQKSIIHMIETQHQMLDKISKEQEILLRRGR